MFVIRIAEFNIGIENKYSYIYNMCRDYMIDDAPEFIVEVTDTEILKESNDQKLDKGYLESLAIYRKIAEILIEYNTFLLHGAIIDVDGCGVGFLAKSGTGKTTHMLLWKELLGENLTIINGDKPLIKVGDKDVYAYGTPWCGKEKLNTNTKTYLKKICFIERDLENSCKLLDKKAAFERLIKQTYIPRNREKLVNIIELVFKLIDRAEFYVINCNTDISAAEIAFSEIISKV